MTEQSRRDVSRQLIELPEGGDLKAIELLLSRTVGSAADSLTVAIQNNVLTRAFSPGCHIPGLQPMETLDAQNAAVLQNNKALLNIKALLK